LRVVANPNGGGLRAREQALRAGLLPRPEHLERARHLVTRFPEAALREVALHRVVPVDGAGAAGSALRSRVWLALESMQRTGSFKVRGALMAMETLRERHLASAATGGAERPFEVVAASAGNHGIGVALAAAAMGAKATIVVPSQAPRTKVDKIASFGATVVLSLSPGYDGAEAEAMAIARSRDLPFVSAYDDLDVVAGNGASLGFEIVRALGRAPDLVLCPIGGGGLATGLASALLHEASASAAGGLPPRVWGVQSEASPAFAMSLERGAAVTELPPAATLAEGLEGGIAVDAFARASAVLAGALVATERELEAAIRHAFRELGLVLEGSAAVALTPLLACAAGDFGVATALGPLASELERDGGRDVVCVLTGRNVDPDRLAACLC